jgi:hypothetical protein
LRRRQRRWASVTGRRNGFTNDIGREGMTHWFTAIRGGRQIIKPTKESLSEPSSYTGEHTLILALPWLRRRCGKGTGSKLEWGYSGAL